MRKSDRWIIRDFHRFPFAFKCGTCSPDPEDGGNYSLIEHCVGLIEKTGELICDGRCLDDIEVNSWLKGDKDVVLKRGLEICEEAKQRVFDLHFLCSECNIAWSVDDSHVRILGEDKFVCDECADDVFFDMDGGSATKISARVELKGLCILFTPHRFRSLLKGRRPEKASQTS